MKGDGRDSRSIDPLHPSPYISPYPPYLLSVHRSLVGSFDRGYAALCSSVVELPFLG